MKSNSLLPDLKGYYKGKVLFSQASVNGGVCCGGGLVETPPGTATAAGGTHPTGMHSCLQYICIRLRQCGLRSV